MTKERIEELYKSGVITFQEALELGSQGVEGTGLTLTTKKEPVKEEQPTKKEMVDNFIDNILEPETVYEEGEYVTYDFLPIDEILDHLERNKILWRGEKPTVEMVEKEIKELTKSALTRCITYADEGHPKEDCACWVEDTCFRADAYFEGGDKNISIDVRFIPEQGFQMFDYEKYKLLPGEGVQHEGR